MRYIDRTNKKMGQKGTEAEILTMGALTREATKKAEEKKLGLLKSSHGGYRIIRESGLGYLVNGELVILKSLEEVNTWFINK